MLRYCARPGVSLERLSRLPDGRFAYRVKHPIGTKTHRVMEPMDLMARLASIVVPPRHPLVRYYGLFAPGCTLRKRVVPGRPANRAPRSDGCAEHESSRAPTPAPSPAAPPVDRAERARETRNGDALTERAGNPASTVGMLLPASRDRPGGTRTPWADLMRHGFDMDVLRCPRCASRMYVIAVVHDRAQARRYVEHLGVPLRDGVPQRAWDPVPFDPSPPDGWAA